MILLNDDITLTSRGQSDETSNSLVDCVCLLLSYFGNYFQPIATVFLR